MTETQASYSEESMVPITVAKMDMGEFSKVEVRILKSGAPGNAAVMKECAKYFLDMAKRDMDRLALEIMRYGKSSMFR